MAVSAVAGLTAAIGQGIATGFALSTFATTFAVTAGLSALSSRLLAPKKPSFQDAGRNTYVRQAITEHDVIYGEVRKSGPIVYIESTDNDKYLHMVIALAGHEVEAIDTILIHDEELTLDENGNCTAPSKYANLIRVNKHLGATDQDADADLVSESNGKWTNAHRMRGVAYVYVRLEFDADSFPSGIPAISAIVRGKKLFDPRDDTTTFSSNPALILRDYLSNDTYGLGATDAEIDDESFKTAANICDEDVTLSDGGTENRYEDNGIVSTADTPRSNIEAILSGCAGILYYTGGKWATKAAAATDPVMTITDDDLRSSVEIQTRHSRRDNFNGVKGIFTSPEANWQTTDFPSVLSETFKTADGGEEVLADIELPFTTSSSMAQRIAKIQLYKNRQQLTMTLACNLKPMTLTVGDVVNVQHPRFWDGNKEFEVVSWVFNTDPMNMGVDVTLRETSDEVYAWDAEEELFEHDNTTLPDPFLVNAPGVTVTDTLRTFNEEAVTFLVVNVNSSSLFTTAFEVEARKSGDSEWTNMGRASGSRFELPNVEDDSDYEVRARAVTATGVRSAYTTLTHTVQGKLAPPQDVVDFKVNIIGTEAHLSWQAATDADLSHYRIRHSSDTSGATYSNAQDLARKVSRPATSVVVPAKTGTYFIKAVDKLGNSSVNSAQSIAIVSSINGGNVVETITESPTFSGTKTNCELLSGDLIISSGNTTATYLFDGSVDLGDKYQARLTNEISIQRYDRSALFDDTGGLFDDRSGLFDGGAADFDDIDTRIEVRTTDDDPAGSPTWSDWRQFDVGEYAARAFQFRLILNGDSTNVSPQVTSLSVTVDMPDRVLADSDIVSGAAAKAVSFSPAFKSLQGIGVSATNLASGDYYTITSKSTSGFTITFYDSSDTIVSRTFDYVARGYGEVI